MNYNLGSEVNNLRGPWQRVQEEAKHCAGVCGNCAGKNIRKFLDVLLEFFERDAQNRPTASQQRASALERIDVNRRAAGSNEYASAADRWEEIHSFFNKCAHHGPTTLDELQGSMLVFEELLIDLFLPSPSGDMSEIDEILAEEDGNA